MPITTPANEAAILPTLSASMQQHYREFKDAAHKVEKKHPDTDTAVYSHYLSDYLNSAREFTIKTKSEHGLRIHPHDVEKQEAEAEKAFMSAFDAKYPIFTDSSDPAVTARVTKNHTAIRRVQDEINGDGIFERFIKGIYNEDRGGFQWASIAGGAGGLGIGYLMGNRLASGAGELGAGWVGAATMGLLSVSGMVFFSKLADGFANPQHPNSSPAKSTDTPAKTKAVEAETPKPNMEAAQNKAKEETKPITTIEGGTNVTTETPPPAQPTPASSTTTATTPTL